MRFDVPADRAGTASFEYEVCGARGGPDNDDDRHDQRHRWQWILEKLLRYYGHGRGGGQRRCDRATVSVRVDRAPVVDGELVQTFGDVPVRIEVLANDFDPDAGLGAEAGTIDPGSVRVLAGPSSGTTVVDADGVVTYSPAAGFVGVDGFDYEVCDGLGLCGSSSVSSGMMSGTHRLTLA